MNPCWHDPRLACPNPWRLWGPAYQAVVKLALAVWQQKDARIDKGVPILVCKMGWQTPMKNNRINVVRQIVLGQSSERICADGTGLGKSLAALSKCT